MMKHSSVRSIFVPLVAFVEYSALYFGTIFAEALRSRDAEIERLRRFTA